MRITLAFRFNHEESPVAVTGVEGEVVDLLLPSVGDSVSHRDVNGRPFTGKVTERLFEYDLRNGEEIDGTVTVTLCLNRTKLN